jgi:hypothetical protein
MMRKTPAPEVAARFGAPSEQERRSSARVLHPRGRRETRFRVTGFEIMSPVCVTSASKRGTSFSIRGNGMELA